MELKAGKSIAEKGGIVYLVEAKAAGVEIKEDGGKFVIPSDTKLSEISDKVATEAGYSKPSSPSGEAATFEEATPTKSNAHEIGTLAELETFRDLVNGGFSFQGCTVKLTANITLEKGWIPIAVGNRDVAETKQEGSYSGPNATSFLFKGTFDGQGHTISNLTNEDYIPEYDYKDGNDNAYTYGFFGIVAEGAELKNIKFSNVNISKDFGNVSKASKATGAESIGALVGYVYGNAKISDITVLSGSMSSSKENPAVGGVVGRWYSATKDIELKNLKNSAKLQGDRVGGIVGFVSKFSKDSGSQYTAKFDFASCTNSGQLTGNTVNQMANFNGNYSAK